jgi:hypothetical protein
MRHTTTGDLGQLKSHVRALINSDCAVELPSNLVVFYSLSLAWPSSDVSRELTGFQLTHNLPPHLLLHRRCLSRGLHPKVCQHPKDLWHSPRRFHCLKL